MKSEKVKYLCVTVTYTAECENVEMPKEIYEKMLNAAKNGENIDCEKYPDVASWMSDNISEKHAMFWDAAVNKIYLA